MKTKFGTKERANAIKRGEIKTELLAQKRMKQLPKKQRKEALKKSKAYIKKLKSELV